MTRVNAETLRDHLNESEKREENRYWIFLVYIVFLFVMFFLSHKNFRDPRTLFPFGVLAAAILITIGRKVERFWIRKWMSRGDEIDNKELLN